MKVPLGPRIISKHSAAEPHERIAAALCIMDSTALKEPETKQLDTKAP